ncbi:MAG: hypothetical protein KDK39_03190 [Leptospiraceae bacterium]|nr:hypothetical protein [Leptospiraceae bacterium]
MKPYILILIALFIPWAGVSAQHVYKTAKFSITFPGQPSENTQDVETAVGRVEMHSVMHEAGSSAYMLAYTDYPESLVRSENASVLLQNAKDSMAGSLGTAVTYEQKITLKGQPGLYYKAQGSGYYLAFKIYMVNNRLYQIGLMRNDRLPTDAEIDGYINTFRLK